MRCVLLCVDDNSANHGKASKGRILGVRQWEGGASTTTVLKGKLPITDLESVSDIVVVVRRVTGGELRAAH